MIHQLVKCPVCEKMNLKKESESGSTYSCSRCTFFFSVKDGKYSSGVTVEYPDEYEEKIQALRLDVYDID